MPEQESMDEARKRNADLDAALRSEGIVDQSLYSRFSDAYGYNAASSVGWVEAKMDVLLARVQEGKPLSVFIPSSHTQRVICSELEFRAWIGENFHGLNV